MNEMNKPPQNDLLANSIIEILLAPLVDDIAKTETLFVDPRGNLVRKFDREEIAFLVNQFARGMSATHLKRGSKVAFNCKSSVKAIIASLANLLGGFVNVVLPSEATLEDQLQALASSRTETLIVDTIESALPILQNIKALPQLRQIVVLSESDFQKQPEIFCISWKDLMQRGESQPDKLAALRQAITPDQEAFLYFQYDSKQRLKGSLQTHAQMLAQLRSLLALMPAGKPVWERMLALTPFHHPHSYIASVLLPMTIHQPCMVLDLCEGWKIETLPARNTLLVAEAAFYDEISEKLEQQISQAGGILEKAWERAVTLGENILEDEDLAQSTSVRVQAYLLRLLLGTRLKEYVGGRLHTAIAFNHVPGSTAHAFYLGIGTQFVTMLTTPQEMLEMSA